jgi:hypothetical protein
MKCPQCGQDNPIALGSATAAASSWKLAARRAARAIRRAAEFCNGCGQSLTPAPASERTPASYTPKHLAERILTSKAALEGERKHLAEIYGWFTEGFDTRDLREAKLLLDEVS